MLDGSMRESDNDSLLREVAGAPPRSLGAVHLLAPGAIVAGKYRIEEKIGTGGMGAVFRATDLRLQRPVAIKVHHSRTTSIERLRREARLLARLSHPNVVTVMEVGSHEGALFVAMEYVAGGSARTWARQPGRTWREIVALYIQAARGLAAAHAIGIVHRDFKPDNLLVGTDGRAHVADFGLADEDLASAQDLPLAAVLEGMGVDTGSHPADVTAAGSFVGTPAYVAPEQIRSSRVDARADQFSFCAALFEALYGELPFPGSSAIEVLSRIVDGDLVEPAERGSVPRWLHLVVCRGLSRAPERRFADMDALREALAGPRSRRGIGLGAAVVAAFGVAVATNRKVESEPRCAVDAAIAWTAQREAVAATVPEGTSVRDAWRRLDRRLDERGQAWSAAWVTSCAGDREDATPLERQTMARRLDCLDDERRLTDALFETLAASDPGVIAHLLESASSWGDPFACLTEQADAAAVASEAEADQPGSARALLQRSRAAADAGQTADALVLAEAAVVEAQRVGDDLLTARALLGRGRLRLVIGRFAAGVEDTTAAYTLATRVGDEDVLRDTCVVMAMAMASGAGDGVTTMEWINRARRHLHRWPDDADDQVRLLTYEASVRGARGEFEPAQTLLDEAETIAQQVALPGDQVAGIWLERAQLATGRGDFGNAVSHAERGRDLMAEALGNEHFRIGEAWMMLAFIYDSAGNIPESLASYRRALALFEGPGGGIDRPQIITLVLIATLETLLGQSEQALVDLDRAVRSTEAMQVDDPELQTNVREARGLALQDLGRLEEAYAVFVEVMRESEAGWGTAHPKLRAGLLNLALAARSTGRTSEAMAALERAKRIQGDLEADDVLASDVYHAYGFALLDAGRHEDAAVEFEHADKVLQRGFGDDHPDHGWPALGLARVELARGNPSAALDWVARAETAWQGDQADAQGKAELALSKADALAELGRKDEALAVARAAFALRPGHVGLRAWLERHAPGTLPPP